MGDIKIVALTVIKAFIKREGITENNMATAEDFGDYLLRKGDIKQEYYEEKQREARRLLEA